MPGAWVSLAEWTELLRPLVEENCLIFKENCLTCFRIFRSGVEIQSPSDGDSDDVAFEDDGSGSSIRYRESTTEVRIPRPGRSLRIHAERPLHARRVDCREGSLR